jgi:hypothetical protein
MDEIRVDVGDINAHVDAGTARATTEIEIGIRKEVYLDGNSLSAAQIRAALDRLVDQEDLNDFVKFCLEALPSDVCKSLTVVVDLSSRTIVDSSTEWRSPPPTDEYGTLRVYYYRCVRSRLLEMDQTGKWILLRIGVNEDDDVRADLFEDNQSALYCLANERPRPTSHVLLQIGCELPRDVFIRF